MIPASATAGPRDQTCHLCGDAAVVGRVVAIDDAARTGIVAFDCGPAAVAFDLVDASVGEAVLVHLGFAIARLEVA